jgi:hypothetical protein
MSTRPSSILFWLVSSAAILSLVITAPASAAGSNPPLPEIVRIRYLQGDVRLSKGSPKELDLTKPWEVAEVNVPIEEGFVLATGNGRAEVEFESLTIVYLAENSVLYFQVLQAVNGVPQTRLQLVTGTVTVAARSIPTESFTIQGSATNIDFPKHSLTRVDNYLDATFMTPEGTKGENFQQAGSQVVHLVQGQTVVYQQNHPVQIQQPAQPDTRADWDSWVLGRVKAEHAAIDSAQKAAGASAPIPGIDDLLAQGSFFPCPPYGMCWQPQAQLGGEPFFRLPCLPGYRSVPLPLRLQAVGYDASGGLRWTWAVCHAGFFVHHKKRYAWVVGKKHHHPPIRWVHFAHSDGFVLAHPSDQKDKLPLNLKHGVLIPSNKPGEPPQEVDLKPSEKVAPLANPPKAYRSQPLPELARAERPEIQAHFFAERSGAKQPAAMAIKFDYKQKTFVATGQDSQGRTIRPVVVGGISGGGSYANSGRSSGGIEGRSGGGSYSGSSSRSMSSGSAGGGASSSTASQGGGSGRPH